MHTEGRTHRRVKQRRYWLCPVLVLVLVLCGCTTSRRTRQVRAPAPRPAPVVPIAATYTLEDIRPASLRDTTQVVITVSGPVQPLVQYLSQPDRLAIDLPDTQLPPQWNQHDIPFSDSRLQTIQVRQSQANKVQLTLALQAVQDYRISCAIGTGSHHG